MDLFILDHDCLVVSFFLSYYTCTPYDTCSLGEAFWLFLLHCTVGLSILLLLRLVIEARLSRHTLLQ